MASTLKTTLLHLADDFATFSGMLSLPSLVRTTGTLDELKSRLEGFFDPPRLPSHWESLDWIFKVAALPSPPEETELLRCFWMFRLENREPPLIIELHIYDDAVAVAWMNYPWDFDLRPAEWEFEGFPIEKILAHLSERFQKLSEELKKKANKLAP